MIGRRFAAIIFIGLISAMALGALAWACTPSAYLYPVSPAAGPAGTEVTVRGGQFGNGPVEIRWGSEHGRLLGRTLGPEFTTKVTIPDKAEGVHYLVAIARDPADPSRMLARRVEAYEISSNPRSEAGRIASLWSNGQSPAGEDPSFTPTAATTAIGVLLSATAVAGSTLVLLRRRRAPSE